MTVLDEVAVSFKNICFVVGPQSYFGSNRIEY
jgi:hypothetical protein